MRRHLNAWSVGAGVAAAAAAVLLLSLPSKAEPYAWSGPVPRALLAPTDTVGSEVRGASAQGGLIDLRYGQASVDQQGVGVIYEWDQDTRFTLDGRPSKSEELTKLLVEGVGLKVALRYAPQSGRLGWCDALTTRPVPAVQSTLKPGFSPALKPPTTLTVLVPRSESNRLHLVAPVLFAPGMAHGLKFQESPGAWRATLPVMPGWNFKELPLFVQTAAGETYRTRAVSVASVGPTVDAYGPSVASGTLTTIPGWFEIGGNRDFLDPGATSLTVSNGGRVVELVPRAGRVDFRLKVEGPGEYRIRATVGDRLGRRDTRVWHLRVDP